MAEIQNGIRHLLSNPTIYNTFQHMVGAYAWRKRTIDRLVRPLLKTGARLIDIGCGTAEILNYLPNDIAYFGFDRNPKYIEAARQRFSSRNAVFECGSVGQGTGSTHEKFDVAIAAGLIHHLDDDDAIAFLQDAKSVLKEDGALILIADPLFTSGQSALARYIVSKDRGQNVRNLDSYLALYRQVFDFVDAQIDNNPLRIPYTGAAARCSSKPLL